jgi:hypothetical protein
MNLRKALAATCLFLFLSVFLTFLSAHQIKEFLTIIGSIIALGVFVKAITTLLE